MMSCVDNCWLMPIIITRSARSSSYPNHRMSIGTTLSVRTRDRKRARHGTIGFDAKIRSIAWIVIFAGLPALVAVGVVNVVFVWRVYDAHILCCSHLPCACYPCRNHHRGCVYHTPYTSSASYRTACFDVCVMRSPVLS